MRIESNRSLTDLSPLLSITSMSGKLTISNCDRLKSLHGLQNIDESGIRNLEITYSDSLSDCAYENICFYISDENNAEIKINAPGCNSSEEVMNLCLVGTNGPLEEDGISIFPNPTSDIIEIKYASSYALAVAKVLNAQGRLMKEVRIQDNRIDLQGLPDGMYLITIQLDDHMIVRRIVKIK